MSIVDTLLLFVTGSVASGINSVAGGGSLVSFPFLTLGLQIPDRIANATNAVGLFPGSFAGGIGFKNQFEKTRHAFKLLVVPTALGSIIGALLLLNTRDSVFKVVVPFLILFAALLLWFQPKIKLWMQESNRLKISPAFGVAMQLLVATYGGYFGAGMGIMMLATFALYIEGTTHELNAVKNWLGTIINIACSVVFLSKGLVDVGVAVPLALGGFCGGFLAAKLSLKVNPDLMRKWISIYGFVMTIYYFYRVMGF